MLQHTLHYLSTPLHCLLIAISISPLNTHAHFQTLHPSTDIVTAAMEKSITLDMVFTHPMERGPVMAMQPPTQFGVITPAGKKNLLSSLQAKQLDGKPMYQADYAFKQPGDHIFFLEPAPYWEATEQAMIIHYTKVVVDAYGAETGWETAVGFPVEIEPLVRPYGLWTGNLFRGIVKHEGKPVPFAEIEVEWYNDGSVTAPFDAYITQLIKADSNGVFSYAMPRAGWWGFAALVTSDTPMQNPAGESVPVELGGLIWVYTRDMQ